MAKVNYRFDKQQREKNKAKRQEEKRLKKLARNERSHTKDEPK